MPKRMQFWARNARGALKVQQKTKRILFPISIFVLAYLHFGLKIEFPQIIDERHGLELIGKIKIYGVTEQAFLECLFWALLFFFSRYLWFSSVFVLSTMRPALRVSSKVSVLPWEIFTKTPLEVLQKLMRMPQNMDREIIEILPGSKKFREKTEPENGRYLITGWWDFILQLIIAWRSAFAAFLFHVFMPAYCLNALYERAFQ